MKRIFALLTLTLAPLQAFGQSTGGLPALREDLVAEINRAGGQEAQLRTAVGQEVARATAAEGSLSTSIAAEAAARQAASLEVSGMAKSYTDARILSEVAARQAATLEVSGMATAYTDARVMAEATARQAAHGELQNMTVQKLAEAAAVDQALNDQLKSASDAIKLAAADAAKAQLEVATYASKMAALEAQGRIALKNLGIKTTVLTVDRKLERSLAASQAVQVDIAALVSQIQPGATAVVPDLVAKYTLFETQIGERVGLLTLLRDACNGWQDGGCGDPSPCPPATELQSQIEEMSLNRQSIAYERQLYTTMWESLEIPNPTTSFEVFDQKSNQLFNILATVLKNQKEMAGGITRNIN